MPDITTMLADIAAQRRSDPLAPVTVVVPSHVAGLQLRRRLAQSTPFAAVRFETLPRLAELIAAGHLAGEGRSPLARPIGDYVAGQVACQSAGAFESVRDLSGYARALRQAFRRLRRGGIRASTDVEGARGGGLVEVLRLYDRFRDDTSRFYDEEDLLDAAATALLAGQAGIARELGSVYIVPPGAQSAGAQALLEGLREKAPVFFEVEDGNAAPVTRMVLAPDPASEAREVVREAVTALEAGLGVHELAVFHGAGGGYPRLLREAFEAAGVPAVSLPGIPLSESATGRAVLALLNLPNEGFSRTRTMDFFALAPLRDWIPAGEERARANAGAWDRVSRAAGITRGIEKWRDGMALYQRDLDAQLAADPRVTESQSLTRLKTFERERAIELVRVIEALVGRLQPLNAEQPVVEFISAFDAVVSEYFWKDAEGYEDVLREIEQLGTVDAVGGSFSLRSFHEALRANLEAGVLKEDRPRTGEGVLVGDYRMAAGLQFRQVVLCGAYEGALPASAGAEPLLDDRTWSRLREAHPFVDDSKLRIERSREAAVRAAGSAGTGTVVWVCPVYEPGATRDFYPSPLMVKSARGLDPAVQTATRLRRLGPREWLRRSPSPLATMLQGATTDVAELTLRCAVALRRSGRPMEETHPQRQAVEMLRARRSVSFSEWDGNLAALSPADWLAVRRSAGPTTLETYAVCGFRYFSRSVLGLYAVKEPEEREMMEASERGTLVHKVLERFFRQLKEAGRPLPGERWGRADRDLLKALLDEELATATARGLTGREIYSGHEARLLNADLMRFLDADDEFRAETGAVPSEFETPVPEREIGGVVLRGKVDRVDRTPDGESAWVIDYKSGAYADIPREDPLSGGTKLQLPTYLAAAGGVGKAQALYWFITHRGGFRRVEFEATPENLAMFEQTVSAIVDGVKAGSFPAVSGDANDFYAGWENCTYCEFDRLCSRRRDYEYAAKSGDPGMKAWQRVAEAAAASGASSETDGP